ncbi:MAG TPA: hypothetical protein VFO66_11385 [Gemmatimonadaceae bacterium]|nr:hypothetical protein [Gemmatimonadaceae bacterium]
MVALAAERLAADARAPIVGGASLAALGDIGGFVTPLPGDVQVQGSASDLRVDPLGPSAARIPVARGQGSPTVNARVGRQLTAILIADDRPIAVIDGALVNVGDVLPDGGRVAAIRSDRVAISERNGQMRILTISGRR